MYDTVPVHTKYHLRFLRQKLQLQANRYKRFASRYKESIELGYLIFLRVRLTKLDESATTMQ